MMPNFNGTKKYSGVQRAVGEPNVGENPRNILPRKNRPEPKIGMVLRGKPTLR